jgi:hypothetical protein
MVMKCASASVARLFLSENNDSSAASEAASIESQNPAIQSVRPENFTSSSPIPRNTGGKNLSGLASGSCPDHRHLGRRVCPLSHFSISGLSRSGYPAVIYRHGRTFTQRTPCRFAGKNWKRSALPGSTHLAKPSRPPVPWGNPEVIHRRAKVRTAGTAYSPSEHG